VRPCIGCNHGCFAGIRSFPPRIGCTVNVGAGHEAERGDDHLEPARTVRHVLVAGGGPAGLECARVAALRGHRVTLCEARAELGGQLAIARRAPYRSDLGLIVDWLAGEVAQAGVAVRLDTPVDRALIDALAPDAVVDATGCVPRRDGFQAARPVHTIAGLDPDAVQTSWDVLGPAPRNGGSVLVLDDVGHYEAIAVIDRLFEQANVVHVVSRFGELGALVEDSLSAAPARGRFGARDFHFHPRSWLVSLAGGRAEVASIESTRRTTVEAESVIVVSGAAPPRPLDVPDAYGGRVAAIGDALGHRFLLTAIHEGNRAGREL
jgi:hypothetical protein